MKKIRCRICFIIWICLLFLITILGNSLAEEFNHFPVKGMVTMIDLGARKCIPCKMMAPVMEKIEKVYKKRAAIVFIDVREHHEQASRFNINTIPTQIFFDKNGREIYRHLGYMSEKDIVHQLTKMGVD